MHTPRAHERLLLVLLSLAAGAYLSVPTDDPDLGWHITIGRWILAHGSFPTHDLWTASGLGRPWIAYSWLPEIVFAASERAGGTPALLTLTVLIMAAVAASLMTLYRAVSGSPFFGAALGIFVSCAFVNHFSLRPQSIVWCYFALVLYFSRLLASRFDRKHLAALLAVFVLWANTHISAAIGIAGAACMLFGSARAVPIVIGCFAATLLTPYAGREWLVAYETSSHPALYPAIAEFQPLTILQYCSVFLALQIILICGLCWEKRFLPSVPAAALYFILMLAGLVVVKFVPFALIAGGVVLAEILGRAPAESAGGLFSGLRKLEDLVSNLPLLGSYALLSGIIVSNCILLVKAPPDGGRFPSRSMDFVTAQNLPFPLLNSFSHGGYIMHRLASVDGTIEHPVTIDGRTNLISEDDWTLLHAAYTGGKRWNEYVAKFSPQTVVWPAESPLIALLTLSPDWCSVFQEKHKKGSFEVFIRREVRDRRSDLSSPDCPESGAP